MPMYEFKCKRCARITESLQPYEAAAPLCTYCKVPTERVKFSRTGRPKFIGAGFYETDYIKRSGEDS
jgi:putative FmdB family regulatory protein